MSCTLIYSSRHAFVVAPMAPYTPVRIPIVNPVVVAHLLAKGTNTHAGIGAYADIQASTPIANATCIHQGTSSRNKRTEIKQVADSALATWCDIDNHLSPIVGAGGVAALYKRSLYLTSKDYPCLRRPLALFKPAEYHLLYLVLIAQDRAEAIAVNGAMLRTFSCLLASLIGASLSQRLLQSVLDHPSSGCDHHYYR